MDVVNCVSYYRLTQQSYCTWYVPVACDEIRLGRYIITTAHLNTGVNTSAKKAFKAVTGHSCQHHVMSARRFAAEQTGAVKDCGAFYLEMGT